MCERKEKTKMGIRRTIIFNESIDNELNQYINGEEFRNRSHAIQSILKMWLVWRREKNANGEQTTIFDKQRPLAKARASK
jgi:metal-responsive CopG/Arc/MetJ family transcriptional regulator